MEVCLIVNKIEKAQMRWLSYLEVMDDQIVAVLRVGTGGKKTEKKSEEEVLEEHGFPDLDEMVSNAFANRRN